MGVIDLITRVDSICKKYEKYDINRQRDANVSGDDAFSRLYSAVEYALETVLQKTEDLSSETNKAKAVAMNAEIRRTKARLLEGIPKLQRLSLKKVKGLSKEELDARNDLVLSLRDKIEAIPESSAPVVGGWEASTSYSNIRFDTNVSDDRIGSEYFQPTGESDQFKQEYEMKRIKQARLDYIAEGLDTLKNMAQDINEELDRQEPLMDEIDTKIDKAATDLKSTNVRLKDTVTKLRSSRNFCIDIILLCILLGIAAFIYNSVK
ncbi:syntaxin of plants 73 [Arabidopsis thaliana]|uniref:Syntaxin-73 n=2 Tax=Arabidopsis thaliana TaxID=3702 RepID=SYP73_ARATH|nr:syntaxin of plants 73 [Arabidopsis thaliana]Q94KK5.1 RecName: Full=Syntaxin-73; Short=AtSYP73 [Arabidopsis thaliana]AAK40227.1 syntaxin of plants 73 [Arabidopsis thaliana]AEE80206.1 syntaxin of plants 73 [Arabidopsis thaliana]OAP03363.1 SYP73 [Arabidopsis thaliana]|eukprot:NP_567114.1 syntaxin of plants 73 [Arabidopsis thaliana]